jgi:hypothetical protein
VVGEGEGEVCIPLSAWKYEMGMVVLMFEQRKEYPLLQKRQLETFRLIILYPITPQTSLPILHASSSPSSHT